MKSNKDIEKILLNDSAYEKMVKTKIEREFKQELALAKSYINGVQAEGYLGAKNSDRAKLMAGETDSFVCGCNFVRFVKVKM